MNTVILKGNLAGDPEAKEVNANGRDTTVVRFNLAVQRYFKRSDGTRDKDVTFIPCEAWDSGAETIKKILSKGDPVLINGALKVDQWEKDGQKFSRLKVRVQNFEKLYRATGSTAPGSANNAGATSSAPASNSNPVPSDDTPVSNSEIEVGAGVGGDGDDDIPF